jgi:quercetin dioxygenase-like cupin family protein
MIAKQTFGRKALSVFLLLFAFGEASALLALGSGCLRALAHTESPHDRARIAFQKPFPKLDGTHLIASIVDVRYSPGESSPPHSHPCPLLAYVIEGAVRVQIKGQPEAIYKAGETLYEAPNGTHEFTENISTTDPARLVAFFVCDRQKPLTATE